MFDSIQLTTFDQLVRTLGANAPHALILDCSRRLERAVDYYMIAFHGNPYRNYSNGLRQLRADSRLSHDVVVALDGMRRIRNRVAHEGTMPIESRDAALYAAIALYLIAILGESVPDDLATRSGAALVV